MPGRGRAFYLYFLNCECDVGTRVGQFFHKPLHMYLHSRLKFACKSRFPDPESSPGNATCMLWAAAIVWLKTSKELGTWHRGVLDRVESSRQSSRSTTSEQFITGFRLTVIAWLKTFHRKLPASGSRTLYTASALEFNALLCSARVVYRSYVIGVRPKGRSFEQRSPQKKRDKEK